MIFRLVLETRPEVETVIEEVTDPAYYLLSKPSSSTKSRHIRCGARNVRLLKTCKWIHAEAGSLLYRETKFTVENDRSALFFSSLSTKYLDYIKFIKMKGPWASVQIPNLRNLTALSLPIRPQTYQEAKNAKKMGFLVEDLGGVRQLLLLRGLTSIVIEDPADILKNYPELVDIKKKLDTLIMNTVKRPRKTHGGAPAASMDQFY